MPSVVPRLEPGRRVPLRAGREGLGVERVSGRAVYGLTRVRALKVGGSFDEEPRGTHAGLRVCPPWAMVSESGPRRGSSGCPTRPGKMSGWAVGGGVCRVRCVSAVP